VKRLIAAGVLLTALSLPAVASADTPNGQGPHPHPGHPPKPVMPVDPPGKVAVDQTEAPAVPGLCNANANTPDNTGKPDCVIVPL